ncbi:hypothetical protein ACFSVL_02490 [Amycolatopsis silviterrae]|uniref:Uncharacterized protein n=2 Tax=Amycolatopsis silviterrae TaxID=1656914 RepID=A0ABW5GZ45_9PSEU
MTEADRSFVTVMSRVLGPKGMTVYADFVQNPTADPAGEDFETLPPDADETTRADVAERMFPYLHSMYREHPGLTTLGEDAPRGKKYARETRRSWTCCGGSARRSAVPLLSRVDGADQCATPSRSAVNSRSRRAR